MERIIEFIMLSIAIHALSEKQYKQNKDAIGIFNKDYVKTEIFPQERWEVNRRS